MKENGNERKIRIVLPVTADGGLAPDATIPKGYETPTTHLPIIGFTKTLKGSTIWNGEAILKKVNQNS